MEKETENKWRYFSPILSAIQIEVEGSFAASIHFEDGNGAVQEENWNEVDDDYEIFI